MGKLDTILKKVIKKTSSSVIKNSQPSDTDINTIVKNCRDEIQKSEDSGIMPSPKYFEQVAVISRKDKCYENEIAICEMYIGLVKQYAAKNKLSRAQFSDQVLPKCAPLYKRLHNAKTMLSKMSTK